MNLMCFVIAAMMAGMEPQHIIVPILTIIMRIITITIMWTTIITAAITMEIASTTTITAAGGGPTPILIIIRGMVPEAITPEKLPLLLVWTHQWMMMAWWASFWEASCVSFCSVSSFSVLPIHWPCIERILVDIQTINGGATTATTLPFVVPGAGDI